MFKAETAVSTNPNGNVIIKNADMSKVKELLSLEKETTRSLSAIDRLSESEEGVELWLWLHQAPEMYQYSNRLVSCFLYAPQDEKLSSQTKKPVD
jgi:hypothetical protein